jgi:hypothetical protein
MTYAELRKVADEHAENWGYITASQKPDWAELVNRAYKDFTWATDALRGPEITFPTVIGQAEYNAKTLAADTRDWKSFLDVLYNGQQLLSSDEAVIRREDPLWLTRTSSTPLYVWSPRANILRLYPKPDAVQTVTVYGIRGPALLSADADEPVVPTQYHEAIALRAAYLHCRKFAKTEEALKVLDRRDAEYQVYVQKFTTDHGEESGVDGWRVVAPIRAERVTI